MSLTLINNYFNLTLVLTKSVTMAIVPETGDDPGWLMLCAPAVFLVNSRITGFLLSFSYELR